MVLFRAPKNSTEESSSRKFPHRTPELSTVYISNFPYSCDLEYFLDLIWISYYLFFSLFSNSLSSCFCACLSWWTFVSNGDNITSLALFHVFVGFTKNTDPFWEYILLLRTCVPLLGAIVWPSVTRIVR